jgi:hypothetical protein
MASIHAMEDSGKGGVRELRWCEDEAPIHDHEDFTNAVGYCFNLDKLCQGYCESASHGSC